MKRRDEPWRDEVDLTRLSADRRSIAAGWLVVGVMIALGLVAPTIVPLVGGGHAAAPQSVARHAPTTTLAARCAAPASPNHVSPHVDEHRT
jgi:hypothetical protein